MVRSIAAVIMGGAVLASCQTTQRYADLVGNGRLDLNARQGETLERYLALSNAGNFAIDVTDGQMFWNFCPEIQCASGDWKRAAVQDCEQRLGGPCKLVAQGKDIVWRGPIFVDGQPFRQAAAKTTVTVPSEGEPAQYRIKYGLRGTPGAWIDGRIVRRWTNEGIAYDLRFTDGLVCKGDVTLAGRRNDVPVGTPESGRTVGSCQSEIATSFRFDYKGPYETFGPDSGIIVGRDNQQLFIDVAFGPSN